MQFWAWWLWISGLHMKKLYWFRSLTQQLFTVLAQRPDPGRSSLWPRMRVKHMSLYSFTDAEGSTSLNWYFCFWMPPSSMPSRKSKCSYVLVQCQDFSICRFKGYCGFLTFNLRRTTLSKSVLVPGLNPIWRANSDLEYCKFSTRWQQILWLKPVISKSKYYMHLLYLTKFPKHLAITSG